MGDKRGINKIFYLSKIFIAFAIAAPLTNLFHRDGQFLFEQPESGMIRENGGRQ
jgi:hypothetical protein